MKAPFLASSVSAGGFEEHDADPITTAKKGRLWAADFGASVPIRADVERVNGARTLVETVYVRAGETERWTPPDPAWEELEGDGSAHFGITVHNLSPHLQADIRSVLWWEEV